MRKLVILVFVLIAAKFDNYIFRASTHEVIVSTFQERALQTCQKRTRASVVNQSGPAPVGAWCKPTSVSLMIGKSGLDVHPWQITSSKWNARNRNPCCVIVGDSSVASLTCKYDILNGSAQAYKL